jgi:glycosyltransferase involved in cell wall biosynthesis
MERKLVSVIIPCFNAEMWLREAIDSCLQQIYPEIEIVVVDDGSTDNSLEIIKSYGDKVIWESGTNRGGNYARNRGFALSSGEYIQYLDADDYILPEKIERQIRFLEETGADVVYGDWRYKRHFPDGTSVLEDIKVCGPKEDFLESLLADDRWVPPVGLLFTRAAVANTSGWDESLKAGQDRDFFIALALNGAKFLYHSGCYSIYRQSPQLTVTSFSKVRWLENHCLVLEKAEKKLSQLGTLSTRYRKALATSYFSMAKDYKAIDHSQYLGLLEKTILLEPKFEGRGGVGYKLVQMLFGLRLAERIQDFKQRLFAKDLKKIN